MKGERKWRWSPGHWQRGRSPRHPPTSLKSSMGRIPPSIDLIEILYAEGEMTMRAVHAQVPDAG